MISEAEFTDLRNSLSTGFLVDRVVMALTRTQRLGRVEEKDRPVLQEALELLRQILEGEEWLDSKTFDSRSAQSALAFNRAVNTLSLQVKAPQEFIRCIQRLDKIIDALLQQNRAVDKQQLKLARDFFSAYGRGVFVEAQNIIDRSGEPQGFRLWKREQPETT